MENFITIGRSQVNLRHVRTMSVRTDKGSGRSTARIEFSDGEPLSGEVYPATANYIDDPTDPFIIVKANPGFQIVDFWRSDTGEVIIGREPIIAWKITPELPDFIEAYGVFGSSSENTESIVAILYPDGQLASIGNQKFADWAEWYKYADEEFDKRKKYDAEKAKVKKETSPTDT